MTDPPLPTGHASGRRDSGILAGSCCSRCADINIGRRGGLLAAIFCKCLVLRHRFWSVVTGADIPLNCNIGGGLLIPHPNGIVIHPGAQIGVNCLLFQQVTVGSVEDGRGLPRIGDHVDIGAGAKILGPVSIGSHARIGANAVITRDVDAGSTAFGVNQSKQSQGGREP
jgi:serine O-acetyltransferase